MGFHGCFSLFLRFLPRTKSFGVLIQSFDLFHKVFVLCFFKCLNMIEILKYFSYTHTTCMALWLYDFVEKFQNFAFLTLSKTGHPTSGVLLGLLCNYIKFWYFCVFCSLTQKFTYLRKGPKSLKDKLFCSFNDVFQFVEIFGF